MNIFLYIRRRKYVIRVTSHRPSHHVGILGRLHLLRLNCYTNYLKQSPACCFCVFHVFTLKLKLNRNLHHITHCSLVIFSQACFTWPWQVIFCCEVIYSLLLLSCIIFYLDFYHFYFKILKWLYKTFFQTFKPYQKDSNFISFL